MTIGWSSAAFAAIAQRLAERAGLSFPEHRRPWVEAQIRAAAAGGSVEELFVALEREPLRVEDLAASLTIGETYFFREPDQFAWIAREVVPDVLRRRGPEAAVRVWSAGCSSGEEAYSAAILLDELGALDRAFVLGTDLAEAAIVRARRGRYRAWSFRNPDGERARRRCGVAGEDFEMEALLRRRVLFEPSNLASDVWPSIASGIFAFDVIFCRNVLVYFDPPKIAEAAARLFAALAEGGVLFTASTDPPLRDLAPFEPVSGPFGVAWRRSERQRRSRSVAAPQRKSSWDAPASVELARGRERARAEETGSTAVEKTVPVEAPSARLRSLAQTDPHRALAAAEEAARTEPLAAEVHFLLAVLRFEAGRSLEAAEAARRALYLDGTLAAAHLVRGMALERAGDPAGARRAFRNARDLCRARPPDELVPLGEGERAGRLAATAEAHLTILGAEAVR